MPNMLRSEVSLSQGNAELPSSDALASAAAMIVAVSSVLAGQLVDPPEIALCPHPNVHSNGQIRESLIPGSRIRVTALAVEFDFQYRTPTQEGLFLRKEVL